MKPGYLLALYQVLTALGRSVGRHNHHLLRRCPPNSPNPLAELPRGELDRTDCVSYLSGDPPWAEAIEYTVASRKMPPSWSNEQRWHQ